MVSICRCKRCGSRERLNNSPKVKQLLSWSCKTRVLSWISEPRWDPLIIRRYARAGLAPRCYSWVVRWVSASLISGHFLGHILGWWWLTFPERGDWEALLHARRTSCLSLFKWRRSPHVCSVATFPPQVFIFFQWSSYFLKGIAAFQTFKGARNQWFGLLNRKLIALSVPLSWLEGLGLELLPSFKGQKKSFV